MDFTHFKTQLAEQARLLGFQQLGVADIDLGEAETRLRRWLDAGYHGEMKWMEAHGHKRSRPRELEPGTLRVISGPGEATLTLRGSSRGHLRVAVVREGTPCNPTKPSPAP